MTNENIIYTIPAGIPELKLDTTSAQEHEFEVPADEKWWILNAGGINGTQGSRSSVRWSVDGTNFCGKHESAGASGATKAPGIPGIFPFMLPPGGKITVGAVTFTASDAMIHHVTILKMFSF